MLLMQTVAPSSTFDITHRRQRPSQPIIRDSQGARLLSINDFIESIIAKEREI